MAMKTIRLADLEKLPGHRFRYDNSVRWLRIACPAYRDTASGRIVVDCGWTILGWSDSVDERLMCGREGQVCLMLWHAEWGEAWEHYPLFDQEDRDESVFMVQEPQP